LPFSNYARFLFSAIAGDSCCGCGAPQSDSRVVSRQITEAFPWDSAPKYLIRDNDRAFGVAFKARVRAMGIRDRPTSFRSPWQNG
jgi:hypothetical protein